MKCFLLLIIIFGVICLLTKGYQDLFFCLSERDLRQVSIPHLTLLLSVEKPSCPITICKKALLPPSFSIALYEISWVQGLSLLSQWCTFPTVNCPCCCSSGNPCPRESRLPILFSFPVKTFLVPLHFYMNFRIMHQFLQKWKVRFWEIILDLYGIGFQHAPRKLVH